MDQNMAHMRKGDIAGGGIERAAAISVTVSALLWGIYWIPLRHLQDLGIEGVWTGVLLYAICGGCCLPAFLWRIRERRLPLGQLALGGLLVGGGCVLYSIGLLLTDIVRAILLFYMTPVWGTLLGVMFLGEPLRARRLLALLAGFLGLMVILRADQELPLPRNIGDWLSLAAGISWAWGSLLVFRMRAVRTFDHTFAWLAGGLVLSLLLAAAFGDALGAAPTVAAVQAASWFAVFMSLAVVFPMCLLTLWGCRYLTPGRVGLLLLGEVLVGCATAAMLSGEPFGLREGIGALLILSASFLDGFKAS